MNEDICGTKLWQQLAHEKVENEMNENIKQAIKLLEKVKSNICQIVGWKSYCNESLNMIDKALSLLRECQPEQKQDIDISDWYSPDKPIHECWKDHPIMNDEICKKCVMAKVCKELRTSGETKMPEQKQNNEEFLKMIKTKLLDPKMYFKMNIPLSAKPLEHIYELCTRLETAEKELNRVNAEVVPTSCPSWTGNKCNEAEYVQELEHKLESAEAAYESAKAVANELEAENKRLRNHIKELEEVLHYGNLEKPLVAVIGKAMEEKRKAEQALKDKDVTDTSKKQNNT